MRTVSTRATCAHHLLRLLGLLLVAALASACSEDGPPAGPSEQPAIDPAAPAITITSPARGAYLGDVSTVTVAGEVAGSSKVRSLTINGAPIPVGSDGRFSAALPISPTGTSLFVVEAIGEDGKRGQQTRAFSAGPREPTGLPILEAIVAGLSERLFSVIGDASAELWLGDDLGVHIAPLNPVIDVGTSCVGVRASITGLDMDDAYVSLVPTNGGLLMVAEWTDVELPLLLSYRLACLPIEHGLIITADKIRITGVVEVVAQSQQWEARLLSPSVTYEGLDLDLVGLPAVIEDLLDLERTLEPVLAVVMDALESSFLEDLLSGLSGVTSVPVLGKTVELGVLPAALSFAPGAAKLEFDSLLRVRDARPTDYVLVPNLAPVLDAGKDLQIAVADDAINGLLASLWGASGGAAPVRLGLETTPLGQIFDRATVESLLPLSIAADGDLHLVVPEVIVNFYDNDGVGAELAVNGVISVGVMQDEEGELHLSIGTPQLSADVITSRLPLTAGQLAQMTEVARAQVQTLASTAIAAVPLMRGLGGLGGLGGPLRDLTAVGRGGYVMVSGQVP
jgi:Glucodextranase, domain B